MQIQVIAAVIERNGKFLVCKRPTHKRHGGLWEFPGGKLEEGESLLDAAKRELAEELKMHATACGATLFSARDESSGFEIHFVQVSADGEPHLLEHSDARWVHPDDLVDLELAPTDGLFVAELLKQKRTFDV